MGDDRHIRVPNEELLGHIAELLARGCEVKLAPKGGSMLPTIREGRDALVIRRVDVAEIRRGDILLASVDGGFVIHRARRITPDEIILRGDNNLYAIERVAPADILGRVEAIERAGRRIDCRDSLSRRLQILKVDLRRTILKILSR